MPPSSLTPDRRPGLAQRATDWAYSVGHGIRAFLRDLDRARTLGLAAELAFWLFLSLIPLIAVAGMVAAKLAVGNAPWLDQVLQSVPVQTRTLLREQLDQVAAWNGGAVGVKAASVFWWLASSGVHAVFELLEIKTGARRPWWKRRLLALTTCLALSIGVALLAVLATGLDWVEAVVRGALPRLPWVTEGAGVSSGALRLTAAFCTSVALVTGLYWVGIPTKRRRCMPLLPGAVLAVVAHFGLGAVYIAYLGEIGIGGAYQASLAVIAVTLITLYIFSVALLMGAQLNCTLSRTLATTSDRPPSDRPASLRRPGDGPSSDGPVSYGPASQPQAGRQGPPPPAP